MSDAGKFFTWVEPALATFVATPPDGQDWGHEIKLDGYRILARKDDGRVTLYTRRGNDWTLRMPRLAEALAMIPAGTAFLDGELVSLDARGVSDFHGLQDALARGPVRNSGALIYYAFDLLYLNGIDLRDVRLAKRKALLGELLARVPAPFDRTLRLSEHIVGKGSAFFAQAARMGIEGIVCKRLDEPYRSGRSQSWLKVKCKHRQEFVVVGFSNPKGSRSHLGALLLATYSGKELVYRGRVGTGFSDDSLRALHARLVPLRAQRTPLGKTPVKAETRDVHWVQPTLVAEISFAGLTQDGLLRHSIFLGLREDKDAAEVTLEDPTSGKPSLGERADGDRVPG
jgi:bifunctional non-homologous end joining protein LigD